MRVFRRFLFAIAVAATLTACTTPSNTGLLPYTSSALRNVQDSGGGIPGKSEVRPSPSPSP